MKKRLLFVLCFIIFAAVFASAQTKTVTNSDLEQFRQKRLQAEREYSDNYEKLGFPSPQELKRRNEESEKELRELSSRLLKERVEVEQNEAVRRQNESFATQYYLTAPQNRTNYNQNYLYNYAPYTYLPNFYLYKQRSRFNRNRRFTDNSIPPIRPPRQIRAPRFIRFPNR
jgi:Skp family chaperone for outer membrane proteins